MQNFYMTDFFNSFAQSEIRLAASSEKSMQTDEFIEFKKITVFSHKTQILQ